MQPKPVPSEASTSEPREKEYTSRISDAISSSIFSIGDLFKDVRDGPTSVKFPEKLLKVLEQRLQNIAMGKDATCAIIFSFLQRSLTSFYPLIQLFGSADPANICCFLWDFHAGHLQATDEREQED